MVFHPIMLPFNIGIRGGDFYAKPLNETLGLESSGGVVRLSIAHYNMAAEIERLTSQPEEIISTR